MSKAFDNSMLEEADSEHFQKESGILGRPFIKVYVEAFDDVVLWEKAFNEAKALEPTLTPNVSPTVLSTLSLPRTSASSLTKTWLNLCHVSPALASAANLVKAKKLLFVAQAQLKTEHC
jgi:hypothetical protein